MSLCYNDNIVEEKKKKNWGNNVNTFSFHSKGERLCGLLSEKTDYESLQQQFAHEQQQQRKREREGAKSLKVFNIFKKEFCRTLAEY